MTFISYNKIGYEIIFSKEKMFRYYFNEQDIYLFSSLPINFNTSHLVSSVLPVVGCVMFEIDKQKLGDLFYTLKSDFKEESERFSSMVFNLKHFFTQNSSFQNSFKIKMHEVDLIEPYRFELNINSMIESAYLSFLIENAIKIPNVFIEIVDSDLLIEAIPDPRDTRGPSAVLNLITYFIYNKNKIAKIKSGERLNLLARLAVTDQCQDIDDKVIRIYERCPACAKKSTPEERIGNINPRIKNNRSSFIQKLRIENETTPSDSRLKSSQTSGIMKLPNQKFVSSRQTAIENNFTVLNSISQISNPKQNGDVDKKMDRFEVNSLSKVSHEQLSKGNPPTPQNLMPIMEFNQCSCITSYQNYLATKLRVTYLAYIRFPDGANSLLKAETVWMLGDEPPVKLSINLKSNKAKLNESLIINLTIENNMTQELDLLISEESFLFLTSIEEKHFGAVIMENKLVKTVYIPPFTKDSVALSFTPIKSGLIELSKVSLTDSKTKKSFVFDCNYRILIS